MSILNLAINLRANKLSDLFPNLPFSGFIVSLVPGFYQGLHVNSGSFLIQKVFGSFRALFALDFKILH